MAADPIVARMKPIRPDQLSRGRLMNRYLQIAIVHTYLFSLN